MIWQADNSRLPCWLLPNKDCLVQLYNTTPRPEEPLKPVCPGRFERSTLRVKQYYVWGLIKTA